MNYTIDDLNEARNRNWITNEEAGTAARALLGIDRVPHERVMGETMQALRDATADQLGDLADILEQIDRPAETPSETAIREVRETTEALRAAEAAEHEARMTHLETRTASALARTAADEAREALLKTAIGDART